MTATDAAPIAVEDGTQMTQEKCASPQQQRPISVGKLLDHDGVIFSC